MSDALHDLPDDWSRALAVVAHPDDIEFGAGPAVARWTAEGREVTYLLVTRGEAGIAGVAPEECGPLREEEQRKAAAELGVAAVEFLDGYADGTIVDGPALRRDLVRGFRRHRPELVLTFNHHDRWSSGAWNSADHRTVGRATLDAVADAGNRWIFGDLADEGFEPWSPRRVAIAGSPTATHAVEVGDDARERAVRSLAAHDGYLRGLGAGSPEERARLIVGLLLAVPSARFQGRAGVAFELIG